MSPPFDTMRLPAAPDAAAPDGSAVRVLLRLAGGSMAHFELAAGEVSRAVAHRRVDEIWFIVHGHGEMWRGQDGRQETVPLAPGTCLSIPAGTHFQFRSAGPGPLAAVAVTMPPWPGDDEAQPVTGAVAGRLRCPHQADLRSGSITHRPRAGPVTRGRGPPRAGLTPGRPGQATSRYHGGVARMAGRSRVRRILCPRPLSFSRTPGRACG